MQDVELGIKSAVPWCVSKCLGLALMLLWTDEDELATLQHVSGLFTRL